MSEKDRSSGFSLIEVLAALAVFSLAAIPLAQLSSDTVSGVARMNAKSLARIQADSLMAQMMVATDLSDAFELDGHQIQRGRAFNWRVDTFPSGRPGYFALRVTISSAETGEILATRHGLIGHAL